MCLYRLRSWRVDPSAGVHSHDHPPTYPPLSRGTLPRPPTHLPTPQPGYTPTTTHPPTHPPAGVHSHDHPPTYPPPIRGTLPRPPTHLPTPSRGTLPRPPTHPPPSRGCPPYPGIIVLLKSISMETIASAAGCSYWRGRRARWVYRSVLVQLQTVLSITDHTDAPGGHYVLHTPRRAPHSKVERLGWMMMMMMVLGCGGAYWELCDVYT